MEVSAARLAAVMALASSAPVAIAAQDTAAVRSTNDSISVRFVDADIRGVIQALGRYLPKPVIVGAIQPVKVSLETPAPVARAGVRELLKGLVESQNLEFTEDSGFYRIGPARPLPSGGAGGGAGLPSGAAGLQGGAAVQLFVIRLKHARAADVAATVNLLFGAGGEFSGHGGGFPRRHCPMSCGGTWCRRRAPRPPLRVPRRRRPLVRKPPRSLVP